MEIKNTILEKIKDPLHKNALFLMINSIGTSGLGFIFWIIVAKFYLTDEVGLASAIISSMMLFAILANLGFGIGLIRYLPGLKNIESHSLIISCLIISGIFSLILASIFLLGLGIWSPKLVFLREDIVFIVLFPVFTLIAVNTALLNSIFIANKSAKYIIIKDTGLFSSSKIIFPLFLIPFGALGIFYSWGIASVIAFILGMILFLPKIYRAFKFKIKIEKRSINKLLHFSLGNHIGEIFKLLPSLIFPIIIVNMISYQAAAYFYISWMIANFLFMVSLATTTSLLAESSEKGIEFEENSKRSLVFIFFFLIPIVIFIFFLGDWLLYFIGEEYSTNAFAILRLLSISSIPFAFNTMYITIKRIEKKVKEVILTYGAIAFITFLITFLLIEQLGIEAVGYAWLISQTIICSLIIIPLMKKLKVVT